MYNKIPKIKVVHAIVSRSLILSIIPVFNNKKPTIITGKDEIKTFRNKSLFSKKFKIKIKGCFFIGNS